MAMQNINTGQTQSGTPTQAQADAGWVPVSNSNLPQSSGSADIPSVAGPQLSTMTLAQAQQQAEQAFSGIVSPMTVEDIRAREREAQGLTSKTASAVYDPQINERQRVGLAQVSTAEGVVGQRQGFNISTAELAFVADTQSKVVQSITEVQNQKQAYIDQGNFNAANRADDQLQKLNEFNVQMTMAKANYALQLMSGSREQAQLELAKYQTDLSAQKQQFEMSMSEKKLALDIAGLTGEYEGSPTFDARQADIENAMNAANLTGFYKGNETLANFMAKADIALREKGIAIDMARLEETIRSNRAQESISRALRAGGGGGDNQGATDDSWSGQINAAAQRLVNLRNSGQLSDLSYNAELADMSDVFSRLNITQIGDQRALLNQAMEVVGGTRPAQPGQYEPPKPKLTVTDWENLNRKIQGNSLSGGWQSPIQSFFGG